MHESTDGTKCHCIQMNCSKCDGKCMWMMHLKSNTNRFEYIAMCVCPIRCFKCVSRNNKAENNVQVWQYIM